MAMPGGFEALPHVRLFCGQPSRYLWEDESGNVHHIHQGKGGEQGDALMPFLVSLGQHSAFGVHGLSCETRAVNCGGSGKKVRNFGRSGGGSDGER